ncbi:MAG: hypothetical protein NC253_14365 [Ruminococcus sp.]|nr:hypothetical protein [Ruminococcus sp.]MCM1382327.1 hypothetical protein [Muribaculaceae bacterium]MCM1480948.1 hypothetical protein [Muribaculaceae bacterium]
MGNNPKGGVNTDDKAYISGLIDEYARLIRIKKAEDMEKELDYQIKIAKLKLKASEIYINLDD